MMDETILTPQEYFDKVKDKKQHITDAQLLQVYDNCLSLLNKYRITGQIAGMKKLIFHLECVEKEREIVKAGIDTFVYRSDIEDYIDHIAKDSVKIIELERYEREIPDDIVSVIQRIKPLFTNLYVVFTDYTGKVTRQIEKEKRSHDPILFGTLQDKQTRTIIERFYYLGDWIDEYCELTLDKLVSEVKKTKNMDITHEIRTPADIQELKAQLNTLEEQNGSFRMIRTAKKPLLKRIRTFLTGGDNK